MKRRTLLLVLMLFSLFAVSGSVWAQDQKEQASEPKKRDITVGLIAASAAIAVGLCAIGTEAAGTIILLLAIPETMVILGFVVAIVMLFTL